MRPASWATYLGAGNVLQSRLDGLLVLGPDEAVNTGQVRAAAEQLLDEHLPDKARGARHQDALPREEHGHANLAGRRRRGGDGPRPVAAGRRCVAGRGGGGAEAALGGEPLWYRGGRGQRAGGHGGPGGGRWQRLDDCVIVPDGRLGDVTVCEDFC